jgi:hypothetical protein
MKNRLKAHKLGFVEAFNEICRRPSTKSINS